MKRRLFKWLFVGLVFCVGRASAEPTIFSTDASFLDTRDYTLTVTSAHGYPTPPVGTTKLCWLSTVSCTAGAKTGWNCTGWNGAGSVPQSGTTHGTGELVLSNVTSSIIWNWNANTYTVMFGAEGGTVDPTSQSVTFNSAYGPLPVPTRTGYTFAGWWTKSGGTGSKIVTETSVTIADSHTLYAKWTPNRYTVSFDAQGGETPDPNSKDVTFDTAYGTLASVSRTGYTFAGWWTEAGDNGTKVTAGTTVTITESQTLYARWTANMYHVTFNAQGGETPSPASLSVMYRSPYGVLPNPTRTGYTFAGWWTVPGGNGSEVTSETIVSITGPQTLYAKWAVNNYTASFDAQGGETPTPASKTVTYDSAYGTLATTSRTGYTFSGWWTGASGTGSEVTVGTLVATAHLHTLYAKWTPNHYTVSFDAQGGETPDPKSKNVAYDSPYGALPVTTHRDFVFAGWWTEPDGKGLEATSSSLVTITESQVLYAKWDVNPALLAPVHRFWSDQFGSHFYIMGDTERDWIANKYPGIWNYEDVAWYAYPNQVEGTEPVHRFWSDVLGKHFYIMGDVERDRIIVKYRGIWNYEAVAWYAYREQFEGTDPVGRFWSDAFMGHLYIITESEINRITGKYPGIWNYETVAYWAFTELPSRNSPARATAVNAVAGKVNGAQAGNQSAKAIDVHSNPLGNVFPGLDVVYPLTATDSQVAAYVYDSVTQAWTSVLPATNAPASAVFENLQPDCRYLFDVYTGNTASDELESTHQRSFEYQFDPPESLHVDRKTATEAICKTGTTPTVRVNTPDIDSTLTVKLYSSLQGVVETLTDVSGGEIIELDMPEWDCWYWISGRDDADDELVLSIWLRQERE